MTLLSKPVSRKSSTSASHYGRDADRRIVVTIIPGAGGQDMVELRPERTRRGKAILLSDLWSFLQKCEANKTKREKEAIRKARRAESKERQRLQRSIRSGGLAS